MGCEAETIGPFTAFTNTVVPVPWYNFAMVLSSADGGPDADATTRLTEYYRTRGFPPRVNFVEALAPAGLEAALLAAGYEHVEREHVMFQDEPVEPALPAGLTLGEAREEDMADFSRILQVSFGMAAGPEPEWRPRQVERMRAAGVHHLAAWLDGQLAGVTNLHARYGLAHITAVATDPAYRRRGVAAALTAYAARVGRAEGAQFAALEVATPEAERVYARLGFRRVGERVECSIE
jgi:ribosomal protein S18 acetylase RimI-like enzyme